MKLILGFIVAALLTAAPAAADGNDLTNEDVAGHNRPQTSLVFVPEKIILPEPASGGQGPFDHFNPDGTVRFDDGLSDSSRAVLDRISAP